MSLSVSSAPVRPVKGRNVLLIGAYRQALAVARSLDRAGWRVLLGIAEGSPASPLQRSRAIGGSWRHPPVTRPEAFVEALVRHCNDADGPDLVFPLGDVELALAAPLGPRLARARLVCVAPEILELCQGKEQLMALAASHGVSSHPWGVALTGEELRRVAAEVGFPLVLKPRLPGPPPPIVGGKARRLAEASALEDLIGQHGVPAEGVLVQREAGGPRHNIYFVAVGGELRGIAEMRTLRTDRQDGTGLSVEGIAIAPSATLQAQTAALARALRYTGVGCAQFLVDPATGASCFLEVNARLGANCSPVVAAGLDLPRLFVEAVDGDIPMQPRPRIGQRYAWFGGDAAGLAEELRHGNLGWGAAGVWLLRLVLAQLRARDHVTWSWRDPVPGLLYALRSLRALFTGSARRLVSPSAR